MLYFITLLIRSINMFLSGALYPLLRKGLSRVMLTVNSIKMENLSIMHTSDVQQLLRLVFRKSILAVSPPDLVQREVLILNNKLHIREQSYDLKENCYIVGFGKCVVGMACKVEKILGNHLQKGIISIPTDFMVSNRLDANNLAEDSRIVVYEGARDNLPDADAEIASKEIEKMIDGLKDTDLVIVLISGGGSSLLTLPKPPVTLEEKLKVIKMLGGAGANIVEMNTVRTKLSLVKGGGLASLAHPSKVAALILSDVIGDPLDIIASGPTVQNTREDNSAFKIIQKYELSHKIPSTVINALKETKPSQCEMSHVQNVLIGNNRIALEAAARECRTFGFTPVIVSDSISGLVSEVTDMYVNIIISLCRLLQKRISVGVFITELNPILDKINVQKHVKKLIYDYILSQGSKTDKFCLIFGGEPTVKVVGKGRGGRSQELALRLAVALHELEMKSSELNECDTIFLSGGTDGMDGPTDAAGATAYSGQIKHALDENLDPTDFINRNDSYNFFQKFNKGRDLIITGHTGVNVMDIHILIVQKRVK